MADHLTKKQRSSLMSRVRPKNSKIERWVFAHLRKKKIHFQKHYKKAPGTPDVARPSKKKAVFVHSDFWHGWQYPKWSHRLPSDFWREKIATNRMRDQRKMRQLRSMGWSVMVVWEHSLKRDFESALNKVCRFLRK